jgi:putative transposase
MPQMLRALFLALTGCVRSRRDLVLENLALRQQLAVFAARQSLPRLAARDRVFWIILRRLWSDWRSVLLIVRPETVIRWHRAGFKIYWKWISRRPMQSGRIPTPKALRELIFRMVAENKTWGAPRIHGELKMLGYEISERTVLRWIQKAPRNSEPPRRLAVFLSNHREEIAAMDFLTVPTITFGVLYGFFVIAHDRRNILHFNVTRHPASAWVVQQLREAFPFDSAPGYLIFDRGANFNDHVVDAIRSFNIQPKRTSYKTPWQNGIAERFIGNCRRDLFDHVIVVNERHLKRLMSAYISYYHQDRTHLTLGKESPARRKAEENPAPDCRVVSIPRLGGLHHRYRLAA